MMNDEPHSVLPHSESPLQNLEYLLFHNQASYTHPTQLYCIWLIS